MKAIILARVSTEMQEDGFSLDAQLDRLRKYCSRNNMTIVKEYDITESSTKGKRPRFYEMINFIKKQNEKIAIVVDAVDRLQRGFKETPMLDDLINKKKIELHFIRENMIINEDSKHMQRIMWDMCVLMAKSYVGALAENVKRSENKMLEEGLLPGTCPLGYLNVDNIDKRKKVILDPQRSHLVKKLFEEYSTGLYSMDEMVKKSKEWGLTNRSGKYMNKAQFAQLIQNPFYYGVMRFAKKKYNHIYDRLIDKTLFDKCEEVRTGKCKRTSKHTKMPFTFRGMVRCKHCGCLFSPEIKKEKYIYMRPSPIKHCPHCVLVNENLLLDAVEQYLSSIKFDNDIKSVLAKKLKNHYNVKNGNTYYQLNKCMEEIETIKNNQNKLLDLLITNTIDKETYHLKNNEYENSKIEIENRLEKIKQPKVNIDEAIDNILNFGDNSYNIFKSVKTDEKRKILNLIFSNFILDGKNVEISMRKAYNLLSETRGCIEWWVLMDSNQRPDRYERPALTN